jgi:hypothetical protein
LFRAATSIVRRRLIDQMQLTNRRSEVVDVNRRSPRHCPTGHDPQRRPMRVPGPAPRWSISNERLTPCKFKAGCGRIGAGAKKPAATISCRKSELPISLPHERAGDSTDSDRESAVQSRSIQGERRAKNVSPFMPRNPLISLVSHERIQGNPRKSNPHNQGFSERKGHEPRKSKSSRSEAVCRPSAATKPIDAIRRPSARSAPAPVRTRIPAPPNPCPILRVVGEAARAASSPDRPGPLL